MDTAVAKSKDFGFAPESDTTFFVAGGTLRPDTPSYVERAADRDLLEGLSGGEFCYVLTSRQMGKSSLMARTARTLREQGAVVVTLDLTAVGQNLTPEQWYDGLLLRIGRQIRLEDELEAFWSAHTRYGPVQRLFLAIREVALPKVPGRLVVFVDELDMVRSLPFKTDEFFAAIRECHTRRLEDPEFHRLAFCLLGVATPTQLIKDVNTTPFNIGRRIELSDFSPEEGMALVPGFKGLPAAWDASAPQRLFQRIFHWTGGHPYLSQRLCRALNDRLATQPVSPARRPSSLGSTRSRIATGTPEHVVDQLCEELFLSPRSRERDDNLMFVRERLVRCECDLAELLDLYQRVRDGVEVEDDETNDCINHLRLAGVTLADSRGLTLRNRIYHAVFDEQWIHSTRPETPARFAAGKPPVLGQAPGPPVFAAAAAKSPRRFSKRWLGIAAAAVALLILLSRGKVQPPPNSRSSQTPNTEETVRGLIDAPAKSGPLPPPEVPSLPTSLAGRPVPADAAEQLARKIEKLEPLLKRLNVSLTTDGIVVRAKMDPESERLCQRGYKELESGTARDCERALARFQKALEGEPDCAAAHAGLARASYALWVHGKRSAAEALAAARAAATRAVQLDPSQSEPMIVLSLLARHDRDWARAEEFARAAVELNPLDSDARGHLALLQLELGRVNEAERLLKQHDGQLSVESGLGIVLAMVLTQKERWDEAEKILDEAKRKLTDTERFARAWILTRRGKPAEAWVLYSKGRETIEDAEPFELAARSLLASRAGQHRVLDSALRRLRELALKGEAHPSLLASALAEAGDATGAAEWIEKAARAQDPYLPSYRYHPLFDRLVTLPRFGAVAESVRLNPADESKSMNEEADRLHKQGLVLWGRRTPGAVSNAIQHFERSVALDPQFAACWGSLAVVLIATAAEDGDRATQAAARALSLNPNSASALAALAYSRSLHWQWDAAESTFVKALRADPGNASTHHWYAILLAKTTGRTTEAVQHLREAARMDPTSARILSALGLFLVADGHPDAAKEFLNQALTLDPLHSLARSVLAMAELTTGNSQAALQMIRSMVESSSASSTEFDSSKIAGALVHEDTMAFAVYLGALIKAGLREQAAAAINEFTAIDAYKKLPAWMKSMIHAAAGDRERMYAELESTPEKPPSEAPMIHMLPPWAPFRSEARFQNYLQKMGLPYAAGFGHTRLAAQSNR